MITKAEMKVGWTLNKKGEKVRYLQMTCTDDELGDAHLDFEPEDITDEDLAMIDTYVSNCEELNNS